ncbi:hypothetical protein WICMUC_002944 [Wickerhamomyces mucosus]|uniref:Uncharacterized protein n=1 Tax=Wickerhamomyces mucosus TaxID=1378264 RepID=A0A9P8PPF5_9ASCO|nr:hypothetical protein WICMUC_002944 [Wickerhamomyces mucosus]
MLCAKSIVLCCKENFDFSKSAPKSLGEVEDNAIVKEIPSPSIETPPLTFKSNFKFLICPFLKNNPGIFNASVSNSTSFKVIEDCEPNETSTFCKSIPENNDN